MPQSPNGAVPFVPDPFSAPLAAALQRATAEPPKTAKAACHVAGLQIRLGDLAGARATLEAAHEWFPQSWLLWKFEALVNLEERGPKAAAALEADSGDRIRDVPRSHGSQSAPLRRARRELTVGRSGGIIGYLHPILFQSRIADVPNAGIAVTAGPISSGS